MCRFKSGIILKSKVVIVPGANDSHSDLLESLDIRDDYIGMIRTFVRAELIPVNDEWWVSPEEHPETWKFVVDQDETPEWFDRETHEKDFREAVCSWWKEHVIVDKKIEALTGGYYRLKRCEVKKLCNDVEVWLDNSTVQVMYDSSTVQVMCDNSTVQKMYESSKVEEMRDSSTVQKMYESSKVEEMRDSSKVQKMYESSKVQVMYDSSTVQVMCDNSTVQKMYESSKLQKMHDSSKVQKMYGTSRANDFKNYPHIKIMVADIGNFELIEHTGKQE